MLFFDHAGQLEVLTTAGRRPEDFIEPLRACLKAANAAGTALTPGALKSTV